MQYGSQRDNLTAPNYLTFVQGKNQDRNNKEKTLLRHKARDKFRQYFLKCILNDDFFFFYFFS